ncbi:fasciclin domain-containing protein [Zeaxanthinibacter enoshimensis]|uniref:Putative surface protein with fasciclin (FAS1) repeats n=1 Tax=Zeaxanthinibacter enoshimensis TaxID=392009 RepID=A0A4R6TQ75_9FLAO|nr:fasciclin domain-containing protein [Zeaxanthinibacter enoshimensis]TDQ32437.1 putative surface protein with fasciclin (FAS1) repeats [Zeaxanthinibacter enoshimensis]
MKLINILSKASVLAIFFIGSSLLAQQDNMSMKQETTKMVGGAAMYPSKDIIANAVNSKDHTTLVAAVKAAGLVETLQGSGPFTVFAPSNKAFDKLPEGTVATLLEPENKEKLRGVLTYHVLAGKYSAADIVSAIEKGMGKAEFTTVNGAKLSAMLKGKNVMLMDANGNNAKVTIADVNQSNGVIHVVDTVVLPGM